MNSFLEMSPEEVFDSGGGGPDDDARFHRFAIRSHGVMALAFGFALGFTFMIMFGLFRVFGAPTPALISFVANTNPNLWLSFLYGFVGGTLVSASYNFLVFRRLMLFGLGRNAG
ncbi:MAG: hypothetical protein ACE5I1_14945 [bacterium]